MRICILRSNPIRPDSRVEKEASCLQNAGFHVKIVCWDRDSNYQIEEKYVLCLGTHIPIVRFGIKSKFGDGIKSIRQNLKFQYRLLHWLYTHQKDYDVIHACDFDTAVTAVIIKFLKKKKLVFDIFDFLYGDPKNIFQKIIRGLQNRIINCSDATIICSDERKMQIRDSSPRKLVVLHNTPPLTHNESGKKDKSTRIKVCYVGILQELRLLDVIPTFFEINKKYEFHVGGFGKYEDLYKKLSDENDNIFYYGRISYEKTLELESECDIMLAIYDPSIENHRYAAPNKFYESLMLGKPVIMVKNTGMSYFVDEYDLGITIDYSLKGFESGIKTLESRKGEWDIISENMKQIYRTQFDWENMKIRLVDLYKSIT